MFILSMLCLFDYKENLSMDYDDDDRFIDFNDSDDFYGMHIISDSFDDCDNDDCDELYERMSTVRLKNSFI